MTTLRKLGEKKGMLGDIYAGAMSRFSNPVNLKRLVNLIDEVEWTGLNVDVKAAAYEGLLEKSASEGKKGAGQYFTPYSPGTKTNVIFICLDGQRKAPC
jgi:type I restriction enzyme M protein